MKDDSADQQSDLNFQPLLIKTLIPEEETGAFTFKMACGKAAYKYKLCLMKNSNVIKSCVFKNVNRKNSPECSCTEVATVFYFPLTQPSREF
ncbi:hypothetical protein QE152_g4100 [Popillia japonica]|uniref:Uncharacterized protein n=1 Tax=Popillia japonica TaxID=7064 RepID=A0AAW1MX20_POPJA